MGWTRVQKNVVIAAYLGWTLDAFDFFLMMFVLKDIASEFATGMPAIAFAITMTLAVRPLGAFIFGRLADKYGRRSTLMLNIAIYSALELLSGFSTSLTMFIVLRTLFGIAMGGEWGVGAALTMETIPARSRGLVSGILQAGYPSGYLLASVAFGVLYPYIGWRGMFFVGVLPALLVLYIRRYVPESPTWRAHEKEKQPSFMQTMGHNWKLSIYAIAMMTAFTFFSHGTQDLYPTFLREQRNFDAYTVSWIAIIYNIGAILGGLFFGSLSEKIGRRRAIFIATIVALPVLPLWVFATGSMWIAIGAFLMQFAVQGAWGVVPAHLNEISPSNIRATFPGLVYQLGNLLSAVNAPLQAYIAIHHHGNYALAMGLVTGTVAVVLAALVLLGKERRGADLMELAAVPINVSGNASKTGLQA